MALYSPHYKCLTMTLIYMTVLFCAPGNDSSFSALAAGFRKKNALCNTYFNWPVFDKAVHLFVISFVIGCKNTKLLLEAKFVGTPQKNERFDWSYINFVASIFNTFNIGSPV